MRGRSWREKVPVPSTVATCPTFWASSPTRASTWPSMRSVALPSLGGVCSPWGSESVDLHSYRWRSKAPWAMGSWGTFSGIGPPSPAILPLPTTRTFHLYSLVFPGLRTCESWGPLQFRESREKAKLSFKDAHLLPKYGSNMPLPPSQCFL